MTFYRLGDAAPAIPASASVAPNASLIGKVPLGEKASAWFGAVLRADNEPITLGSGSNVQENAENLARRDEGAADYVGKGALYRNQLEAASL